jgi:hypothetical protein
MHIARWMIPAWEYPLVAREPFEPSFSCVPFHRDGLAGSGGSGKKICKGNVFPCLQPFGLPPPLPTGLPPVTPAMSLAFRFAITAKYPYPCRAASVFLSTLPAQFRPSGDVRSWLSPWPVLSPYVRLP